MATIGENLKVLRENKRWTKQHMSELLGLKSYTTISKWESGDNHPKGSEIKLLCNLFNVSADHLLGIDDSTHYYKYYKGQIKSTILDDVKMDHDVKWLNLSNEVMDGYAMNNDVFFIDNPYTSMNKVIPPGAKIGIMPCINVNYLNNDDIVLIYFENIYSIRRFYNDTDNNRFIFRPETTDKSHIDIVIPHNEIYKLFLFGKVIVTISSVI